MTNVLNTDSLQELEETRMKKIGNEYVKVKKVLPPPIVYNKFDKNADGNLNEEYTRKRAE
jgi:hypothetical protein